MANVTVSKKARGTGAYRIVSPDGAHILSVSDAGITVDGSPIISGVSTVQAAASVRVTNPPLAELVSIVNTLNPIADGTLTIVAQPVTPCKLNVRIVDANGSVTGTLTLVGRSSRGETIQQIIPLTGGTRTVLTTLAWASLTSATLATVAGAAAGDTISIGQSSALGLPVAPEAGDFAVYKANVDDVAEAVGTVDTTACTITPTTLPTGTRNYDFWYRTAVSPV